MGGNGQPVGHAGSCHGDLARCDRGEKIAACLERVAHTRLADCYPGEHCDAIDGCYRKRAAQGGAARVVGDAECHAAIKSRVHVAIGIFGSDSDREWSPGCRGRRLSRHR